ncbi:electron-transferring-flavoprotein dehydrogenase [Angomonas deanei]|uniref:Electron transfer flavoprotein-ubiquinone oxidoreductase n=1 Tax=Angomonas deanei TaxID=59799 RepID=A0A7G2CQJ0_9TRYP|nr:electron-transferring-flavoprotein dehydrogenase [Angomonas deanei]CAD2222106.1 Electron transfer flavoprotein-ubiquinone oxidoreductase, 4Fe-4S, putative [Angomonas deanei]|eukprot:EPY25033.1 electron-transferring-flavoprotein dehydrogenase [Angomonas deanei]
MCKYLAEKAEAMGVEIYPGFAAADILLNDNKTAVEGIILNDMGVNKKGEQTEQFEPGMQFRARQTIFAEGCRGSCTKKLEKLFQLRDPKTNPQTYGLGIKEVWEVPKEKHQAGLVLHSVGWPLNDKGHENTYGGAFLYHYGEDLVSCGFVVGLDYNNPYIRPYMEMQKWKTHELMKPYFEGGKPLLYGARALVEGGYAALPKLTFPGGVLVGDCAGFLNLPKIKGNHTAMKSAILAAEAVAEDAFANGKEKKDFGTECGSYMDRFKSSWLHKELYQVRNVRQSFHKNFYFGMAYTGLTTAITKGLEPWTTPHQADHATLKSAKDSVEVPYPKPDNTLTFDLLTNHSRSGTTHNADQPVHLKLKNPSVAEEINYKKFSRPRGTVLPGRGV